MKRKGVLFFGKYSRKVGSPADNGQLQKAGKGPIFIPPALDAIRAGVIETPTGGP